LAQGKGAKKMVVSAWEITCVMFAMLLLTGWVCLICRRGGSLCSSLQKVLHIMILARAAHGCGIGKGGYLSISRGWKRRDGTVESHFGIAFDRDETLWGK
jgi:hypothetical protein